MIEFIQEDTQNTQESRYASGTSPEHRQWKVAMTSAIAAIDRYLWGNVGGDVRSQKHGKN